MILSTTLVHSAREDTYTTGAKLSLPWQDFQVNRTSLRERGFRWVDGPSIGNEHCISKKSAIRGRCLCRLPRRGPALSACPRATQPQGGRHTSFD